MGEILNWWCAFVKGIGIHSMNEQIAIPKCQARVKSWKLS